jgi:hypothetical protein
LGRPGVVMSENCVRLRSSLRYSRDGGLPRVIGFPFARVDIEEDTLTFSAGRLVPGRPQWTVSREKVTKIEQTQNGVRFYAEGFDDPWVTASLFPKRFLAKLRDCGIVPQGPVMPTKWNSI